MNVWDLDIVKSAYKAVLPWNSLDASVKFSYKTDDQKLIDRCCNCPYSECYNCISSRAKEPPKYNMFVALFYENASAEEICSKLHISRYVSQL